MNYLTLQHQLEITPRGGSAIVLKGADPEGETGYVLSINYMKSRTNCLMGRGGTSPLVRH